MVESTDPEWVVNKLNAMAAEAQQIREEYFGKIQNFDSESLLSFILKLNNFILEYEGASNYAGLRYTADSTDPISRRLNDTAINASTRTGQSLAFIELELGKLLIANPKLIYEKELTEFLHYLERLQRRTPYVLTEAEERLVIGKDKNGIIAWSQIQAEWLSTRVFKIKIDGEEKNIPYGEIVSLYQHPERELRREANRVVYNHLSQDEILWSAAIRSICSDHITMCEWRKYQTPMTQSLLSNDVESGAVDALIRSIEKGVGVYQRYLKVKAKIMGISRLGNWDIVAPIPNSVDKVYTWEDSREIVVSAYDGFDPEWGVWVDEMYSLRHIDGEVRKGKQSGAFCASWQKGKSAYILQSFNGRVGDVYTQAHELGHAIHAYLSSRAQKPMNCEIGSCIAECGSVFGELLLTDILLSNAKTREEKQVVLTGVLDEFGMAAFQVSARVWFEQSIYDAIEKGTFLDGETISNLWNSARDRIYGDLIEWLPEMKWEWTMKSHYYIPNYRFYNYPYVFAQLFVFALYRLYKEQGKAFIPKMRNILAAGSSKSPMELASEMGLDLASEDFWMKGIQQAEDFLLLLEATL
jgi:oligoendopeptidase F